ncbi:Ig-like domain-containing protein, partial [Lelliottia amnigena]
TDSGNNILANTVVTWSITGSAGLTSVSSTTNASGQAEMTFTDTHAETVTLTAKSGGADNGQSKTSSFVANTATAHVSSLTIDDDNHTANGTAQNRATATVTDANGNIVSGSTVDWNVGGNATLSATTSQSDANGKAIVSLTDVVAETVNLSARVGNTMPQVQKTTFTFIVDHLTMTMLVDGHGGLGSSTPNVVKVTAYDVNNDPMPGVALSLRDNDLSITTTFNPSKGKTGADGSLTSDVFSNTLGVLLLVAEVTNSDVPTTAGKTSVNATFTSRD